MPSYSPANAASRSSSRASRRRATSARSSRRTWSPTRRRTRRLVQLGPYHLDTFMDGVLLVFTHHDVPGLIGFIGTIFGKHGVNIAQMTVGRQQPGGEAIAVLNLDQSPPEEAIQEVRKHPQISSIHVVKLPPAGEMPAW